MRPCIHCAGEHPESWSHCPITGGQLRAGAALVGDTIAKRFKVLEVLGSGGMGTVYHAVDSTNGVEVAVKCLHHHHDLASTARHRFLREAAAACATEHPNVVRILDDGVDPRGTPFLVMEFLRGESLDRLLAREGALSVNQASSIVIQLLSGLDAVHRAGVIHRDLKPANVFLTTRGVVKLLDFGVSKLSAEFPKETLTRTGGSVGTPAYMAPEQARGRSDLDAKTDIYACGVILFEALTGRRPYTETNVHATLRAIIEGDRLDIREARPEVPPRLAALIRKALSTNPMDRFSTAAAMQSALDPFGIGRPILPVRLASARDPLPAARARQSSLPPIPEPPEAASHAVKGRFALSLARESDELRRVLSPLRIALPIVWVDQGDFEAALSRCMVGELRRAGRAASHTLLMRIPWKRAPLSRLLIRLPALHRTFFAGSDLLVSGQILKLSGNPLGPALATTLAGFYEGALLRGGVAADIAESGTSFVINEL